MNDCKSTAAVRQHDHQEKITKKTAPAAPVEHAKNTSALIHGDMLIGEVLSQWPETAEIMQDFGLHCTSCSVNTFEPLKAGAMAHGLEEEVVDEMIVRLNELAEAKCKAPAEGIYVTARAAAKIQEFATAEDKTGWGLKITAKDNGGREPAYAMDFFKEAAPGDHEMEFHGIQIFADDESFANLAGADIDFLETAYGSGFKITNPRFKTKGASGGCCSDNDEEPHNKPTGGCGCGNNKSGGCGCGNGTSHDHGEKEGCGC